MDDDPDVQHDVDDERGSWWLLLLPTLTFVVGIALGGGLVYATSGGDAAREPETAPASPTSTGPAGGDTQVTLPAECEQASAGISEAYGLLRDAVDQVRDFQAGALVETLNELQTVDEETRPLVERCSQVSVDTVPTETPTETPTD